MFYKYKYYLLISLQIKVNCTFQSNSFIKILIVFNYIKI